MGCTFCDGFHFFFVGGGTWTVEICHLLRGYSTNFCGVSQYRGAENSLTRPGRKQARKHVRDARDFNNIETRAVIKFFSPLQGKAPKEIHAILTETLAFFLPGRAKDLSAPLYCFTSGLFRSDYSRPRP